MRANTLTNRFPADTMVQFIYLPMIRALLELNRKETAKAIESLRYVSPLERTNLLPAYVRGQVYLAAQQGNEAAAEFQKILDNRGIVWNSPIGALAHLQIARAFVLQGNAIKARIAYQDFFTLWKDADPEIPILKQAKAEHAKLQ